MAIVVVGLNYRTAPVEIREKLTLSGYTLQDALEDLRRQDLSDVASTHLMDEAVILSTCNRMEMIVSSPDPDSAIGRIQHFLAGLQNISPDDLDQHLYTYVADDAVRHLMRVACGLDSMILGEAQILGQITQAYEDAHKAGTTGAILSHLFAQVIHTGKRARTETAISRHTTSVSHAGALLLCEKLPQPQQAHVLVIGAGEMAALAAQALKRFDMQNIAFMNRTHARAEALADEFGGRALAWYQFQEALVWADAVICATGAPHTILHKHEIETILSRREGRSLMIMDIAVPRDVEESVNELNGVEVYDIDDLQSVVDGNIEMRRAAIPAVEALMQQEMQRFSEWYHGRQVTPVIRTLREWAQSIADEELTHTLNRLHGADERTRQAVELLAHRLVNRLLHEPTSRLKIQASEGNGNGYAHAVRELFSLNELAAIECQHASGNCAANGQYNGHNSNSHNDNNSTHLCTLQCILPQATERQA